MPIYEFEGRRPRIAASAYVAPSAQVIGDVRIGAGCYIGHGAILRGDYGTIEVGAGTAIEEGVIVHARPGDRTVFGTEVTVGHGAMIHNARIDDRAVVGMRATVSDYAKVGAWAILGEMTLVRNSQQIPAGKVAVGVPARVVGDVNDKHRAMWTYGKELYQDLARRYPDGLHEISAAEAEVADDEAEDGTSLQRRTPVRVTIVYDNTVCDARLQADHGFAALVEAHGQRTLFDTGADGEILLHNLQLLGIAPDSFDRVVISHPHWDHIGGLPAILAHRQVPVCLPASAEVPPEVEDPRPVEGPGRLDAGHFSTGPIPADDYPLDEHSLVVDRPGGTVVIVGCAHPGVPRILQAAAAFGAPHALIGGLHGFREVDALASLSRVCPAHCTKYPREIEAAWPDRVEPAGAGRILEL